MEKAKDAKELAKKEKQDQVEKTTKEEFDAKKKVTG